MRTQQQPTAPRKRTRTQREIAELAASRSVASITNPGYTEQQLAKNYMKVTKPYMIRHLLAVGFITPDDLTV